MHRSASALIVAAVGIAGTVTVRAEAPESPPGGRPPWMLSFKELDANHDGKLTVEEFRAEQEKMLQHRFDRMDRNHDGSISSDEYDTARAAFEERAQRRLGDQAGREGLPGMPHFDEVDTSGDNLISVAEYQKAQEVSMTRRFEHVDANHDGAVTEDEFDAARTQFQEHMKNRGGHPGDSP